MISYKKIPDASSEVEIELEPRFEAINIPSVLRVRKTDNSIHDNNKKDEEKALPSELVLPEKSGKHFRNAELIQSVDKNQQNEVSRLLDEGEFDECATADATCKENYVSAVHLAAYNGNENILKTLFKHGANPKRMDKAGRSPLHFAILSNHISCVKLLLDKCRYLASINVGDFNEENIDSSILDCPVHDHVSLENKLQQVEIEVGISPLHLASQYGHVECVKLLLDAGANVGQAERAGLTCLDVAGEKLTNVDGKFLCESFVELIRTLIKNECKASSNQSSDFRTTPLHVAVHLQSLEAIRMILRYTAYNALIRNATGDNVLHLAVNNQLEDSLQVLLPTLFRRLRGNVDDVNATGFTPLHLSVLGGWLNGTKLLLEAGADILLRTADHPDGQGRNSVLHLAAARGDTEILALILKCKRANEIVNACNSIGESPLFHTVHGSSVASLRLLLKANADVTLLAAEGRTILHQMIEYGQPELLATLFEHAPSACSTLMESKYKWGVLLYGTPLHMAAHNGNADCVDILMQAGCKARAQMEFQERKECTALHLAAATGKQQVIRTLLKHEPSLVEDVTYKGWLPIHLACQYGRQGSVQALLEEGSDLAAKCEDRDGKTRTAMYLLMHRVRSPVKVLKKVMDNSIVQMDTIIKVNYKVLLPKARDDCESENGLDGTNFKRSGGNLPYSHRRRHDERSNQMRVIDTLLRSGNKMKQHELLMHPLIESFLHLQWHHLRGFYYALIFLYACFVSSFTIEVIGLYNLQDLKLDTLNVEYFRWIAFSCLVLLILHEVIYFLQLKSSYFLQFDSWVKLICYLLALFVTFVNHEQEWPRELTAAAILASWLEFMLIFHKVPKVGYSVLMFSKVASNLFGVLLTFTFLIVGFAITFMIEFRVQPPFETTFEAIVKTIVMMTSEFDYSELFQDFKGNMFSLIIAKVIFVLFLMLVGIVLMNLLVAMAVTDIKDLGNQGNLDRLRKQAEFVSVFERTIFDNFFIRCLPKKTRKFILQHKQVPLEISLGMLEDSDTLRAFHLSQNLRNTIFEQANINRKKDTKTKQQEKTKEEKLKRKAQENKDLDELKKQVTYLLSFSNDKRKYDNLAFGKLDKKLTDLSKSNDNHSGVMDQHQQAESIRTGKLLTMIENKNQADSVHLQLIRSKLNDLIVFEKEQSDSQSKQAREVDSILRRILGLRVNEGGEDRPSVSRNIKAFETLGATQETEVAKTLKLHRQEIGTLLNSIPASLEIRLKSGETKIQQMNKTITSLVTAHGDFAAGSFKAMEDLLKKIGDLSRSIDELTKKTTHKRV